MGNGLKEKNMVMASTTILMVIGTVENGRMEKKMDKEP